MFHCSLRGVSRCDERPLSPFIRVSPRPLARHGVFVNLPTPSPFTDPERAHRQNRLALEVAFKDDNPSLAFCRAPAAVWCVMLMTLAQHSPLSESGFFTGSALPRMLVPGAEDGAVEGLRRMMGFPRFPYPDSV